MLSLGTSPQRSNTVAAMLANCRKTRGVLRGLSYASITGCDSRICLSERVRMTRAPGRDSTH